MFIAMNRFKVEKGCEKDFEQVWLSREVHIHHEPGFVVFHLLRGPEKDDHTLYTSHTMWASYAHFTAWTKSESFRKAHSGAGSTKKLYLGHPEFEGFEAIQRVASDGQVKVFQAA
jgi:heme-degrading monooxygenase HmoA